MGAGNQKSLEQRLLELLGSPRYQPLNKTDLAKRLHVSGDRQASFQKVLNDLETRGKITRIRKDRYVLPEEADLVVGALQVNPQGFGYVVNESGDGRGDLYVAAENQSTAMHQDRVVARIIRDRVPLNAEAGNERKQGALDLDILEVRVRLDEQGKAIALEREQNDASHQLIEELMLLKGAEGQVA